MNRISRLPAAERSALFAETAAKMKTTPAVAEKDFWVTWVLDRLFADAELARLLMFKGGTMKPTGPRAIHSLRAIRGITTIWPGWRRHL